jgi:hypothetical protein
VTKKLSGIRVSLLPLRRTSTFGDADWSANQSVVPDQGGVKKINIRLHASRLA